MGNNSALAPETARHERSIAAIAHSTSRPMDEVRSMFTLEFDRLESAAKIRTHLEALVTAKVRTQLNRKRKQEKKKGSGKDS
jgi:hypothetical protein